MKPNIRKKVSGSVTQQLIEEGIACDGDRCPIKLSVAEAIGIPHGFVHVDATGVFVTRRRDYREKAFLIRPMERFLILYDEPTTRHLAQPFDWTVEFHKHHAVAKSRAGKKAPPRLGRVYAKRSRITGLCMPADIRKLRAK